MNGPVSCKSIAICYTALPLFHFLPAGAQADQVGLNAFSPAASVQTFQGLPQSTLDHAGPLLIGNDLYDSDNHIIRSSGKFGFVMGQPDSDVAIGNDPGRSNATVGFIDIVLGNPTPRAGLYVGFEVPWSANAEFYDTNNNLLGLVNLSANARNRQFAGWQADGGLIGRIHVVDLLNTEATLAIDEVIQEVPEPQTIATAFLGLLVVLNGIRPKSFRSERA